MDPLRRMLALELGRRAVAQHRVTPTRVVEALDEVEDGPARLGGVGEGATVKQLAFDRRERSSPHMASPIEPVEGRKPASSHR